MSDHESETQNNTETASNFLDVRTEELDREFMQKMCAY